ncbi:MAG: hypothetical protein U0T82_15945 [Bacteroidales bacterium]
MLRLFRSNQPLIFFLIPLITLLLWVKEFRLPGHADPFQSAMPAFDLVIGLIGNGNWLNPLFGLLFTLLSAYMVGQLNRQYIFIQERSQMPVIFFILVSGTFSTLHSLHPLHIALPFFLMAISRILGTYRIDKLSYNPFESAFFVGIAGLFYGPSIMFLPVVWIGLLLFRPGYWREWFFTIAGFAVPWIFWLTGLLIAGIPVLEFREKFVSSLISRHTYELSSQQWLFLGFLLLLTLVSSQVMIRKIQSNKILARRSFNLFFWIFFVGVASYSIIPSVGIEILIALAVPVAYLFTHFFIHVRRNWWGELLLWIMTVLVVLVAFS